MLIKLTNYEFPHTEVTLAELEINLRTGTDYASFCLHWVTNYEQRIGEAGRIGDAKTGKRKYNWGHLVPHQLVFARIDQNSRDIIIEPIESRDANTLVEQAYGGRYDDLLQLSEIVE